MRRRLRARLGGRVTAAAAPRGGACGALMAAAALAVAGCGSSHTTSASTHPTSSTATTAASTAATTPAPLPAESVDRHVLVPSALGVVPAPNAVVARVGGHAITEAVFSHAFTAQLKRRGPESVIPAPPKFAACEAYLKAHPPSTEPGLTGAPPPTPKQECQRIYANLQAEALHSLFLTQWIYGAAAEAGVTVSEEEVQAQLKKEAGSESQAELESNLRASGRTIASFTGEIKQQLLAEAIRHEIAQRTAHISEAQVASYYSHNKAAYGLPERRELEIARAGTKAEALKIKREIASGRSFASVVKTLHLMQPIFSSNGVVPQYSPGMYEEPPLNNAIFAAKPHVLSGPVKIFLGYYIFEVRKIFPAQQKTLAQSRAAILQQLPSILYNEALARFIQHWRARWTAATDCLPGYVVAKCRQAKHARGAPPEDSTAFN